jgi:hypothetical protein
VPRGARVPLFSAKASGAKAEKTSPTVKTAKVNALMDIVVDSLWQWGPLKGIKMLQLAFAISNRPTQGVGACDVLLVASLLAFQDLSWLLARASAVTSTRGMFD